MKKAITVTELLRNFSHYINRVTYRGESFVVSRGNLKVAELKPPPMGCKADDLLEYLNSLPRLSAKEEELFQSDLDEVRKKSPREKLRNPWE